MLRWLLAPTSSLSQRVTRAGVWLLVGDGLGRAANFVKLLVLARLLSPADFGLMGVALVVTSIVEYFTELGFNAALVQRRGDIRPYLDTAWVCQIARSTVLAVIVVAAAPLAAQFFREPAAVAIIRVLALDIVVRGFVNPGVVYLRRELQTRREVLWRSAGMMTGFVVGVPAAMMLRNVWALVLSLLAASTVDMLLSYWVHPYRPRPRLRISRARELMQFGRWISWFKAVGFVSSELPGLVVAKTVSPLALGQFQMARQLAVMPPVTLGIHAHGVLFPALVALTDDNERRRAFLRALAVLSAVAIPLAAALTVFGPRLINVGLGAKWRGTELPLQILAWAGCFRAMTLPVSALFMAMGRPRLDFLSGLLNAVVLIALLHPAGATFGVAGVTAIVTLGSGMTFLSQQALVIRQGGVKWLDLARAFSGGIFASLPIFVVVIVPDESAVVSALVATVAAIASGALLLKTLQTSLAGSVSSIKGLQA